MARWAERSGVVATEPGEWLAAATESELREASRSSGVDLASHSWSHPNLATFEEAELQMELMKPLTWLRERFAAVVPWLAYPYGLMSPTAAGMAKSVGYRGALVVDGGWWPRRIDDQFDLPRWNVPAGITSAGFRLRAAGWLCR